MRTAIDETGRTYGEWTVIKRVKGGGGNARWLCQCSCGRQGIVSGTTLRMGTSRSCGKCGLAKIKPGMRIGNFEVIDSTPVRTKGRIAYRVRCKCGREMYKSVNDMKAVRACRECRREEWIIDETGNRYGSLLVLGRCEKPEYVASNCRTWWLCRCDCGNTTKATGAQLRLGQRKSCGCGRRGRNGWIREDDKGGGREFLKYPQAQ